MRTALVLRALHLGDTVTGLPALGMLRRALPDHRIVLAAPAVGMLAVRAGVVDDLTPGYELMPLVGAPDRPDVAIDLHGNGQESVDLLAATGPLRLVSYDPAEWHPEEHEVDRWNRLVHRHFGGEARPLADHLPHPRGHGLTVVHPGAASASRRWPPERFAAVAAELARRGHRVVVSAGPGERPLAARVGRPVLDRLDLDQLHTLVGGARLVVSGDTGIAHLAAACAVPTVTLFGPVTPRRWGPPPLPRHQVLWPATDEHHGDPHGALLDPVLAAIEVDDVLAAAERAVAA